MNRERKEILTGYFVVTPAKKRQATAKLPFKKSADNDDEDGEEEEEEMEEDQLPRKDKGSKGPSVSGKKGNSQPVKDLDD